MQEKILDAGQSADHGQVARQMRALSALPWLLVAALLTSNLMTLLNDRFHFAAHEALERLAAIVALDAVRTAVQQSSPAAVVKRKIAQATQQVTQEHEQLRARHSELDRQHRQLQGQYTTLKNTAARRTQALGKFAASTILRVGRNKAAELGSLVPRSVPYAGIAATVLATAYEIKSDCELLQDLNGLLVEHDVEKPDTTTLCGFEAPSPEALWNEVLAGVGTTTRATYEAVAKAVAVLPGTPAMRRVTGPGSGH
jgi:chaperonin cofactor prefoldin